MIAYQRNEKNELGRVAGWTTKRLKEEGYRRTSTQTIQDGFQLSMWTHKAIRAVWVACTVH